MADTAVHLEQRVLPEVPIRHWICSLPWGLRSLLGYDRSLCSEVVAAFVGELSRSLKGRAKRQLGLRSVADAYTGAVAAIQRTDSALRLNVHPHVLALDGVYIRRTSNGPLVFCTLPTPTHAEVADVARRTADRIEKILQAHGRSLDPEMQDHEPHAITLHEPGLAACYAAAAQGVCITGDRAGQPTLRLIVPQRSPATSRAARAANAAAANKPAAEVRGVNVYAQQVVDGRDRPQIERLCRYITRPPLAQENLELRPDGRIELTFKSTWRDGTRAIVFEPHDILTRLVAAVPPPRFHLLRYFGVLSSHSSLRAEVVPEPLVDPGQYHPPPAQGDQLLLLANIKDDSTGSTGSAPPRSRWSWLLKHVFAEDLDTCARCGGPMRWLEAATTPDAIGRLMANHGLAPRPPPARRAASIPEQLPMPFSS